MDEGSALLHHLERRFNRWLCSVVIGNAVVKDTNDQYADDAEKVETLSVCGSDDVILAEVVPQIRQMLLQHAITTGSSQSIRNTSITETPILLSQINDEIDDVRCSRYLLMVCNEEVFRNNSDLAKLLSGYRQAKRKNCSVLLLIIVESDCLLSVLHSVIRIHPELGILYCTKRIYTVARQHGTLLLEQASPVLGDWLSGALPDDTGALEQLDYSDIFKIVVRDLHESIPGLDVFLRLSTMIAGGLIAVLLTVIVLALISTESPIALDVRQARLRLQLILESQRLGKSEWGWRDTPSALIALQLNDPSWGFTSQSNQRSIDRMEIGLLSEISKLTLASRRRQLTPSILADYTNALLAVYLNPRSFHGHDLLSTLSQYIDTHQIHTQQNNFLIANCVIAIFNAGLKLDRKHVTWLLARQRNDGSFPLGADEAAITVQALTCFDEGQVPRDRLDLTLEYLMRQRQSDGSFGSLLTTALVTQVFNATRELNGLNASDYQLTVKWMVQQTGSDVIRKNVHLAASLLMALNGKSSVSIRNLTGYRREVENEPGRTSVSLSSSSSSSFSSSSSSSSFSSSSSIVSSSIVLDRYLIPDEPLVEPEEKESVDNEKNETANSSSRGELENEVTSRCSVAEPDQEIIFTGDHDQKHHNNGDESLPIVSEENAFDYNKEDQDKGIFASESSGVGRSTSETTNVNHWKDVLLRRPICTDDAQQHSARSM